MISRLLSRYWLVVPLLLLAIVARDWAEETPVDTPVEATLDMRSTQSDYYLEGFTTKKYDAQGAIEYEISGQTLAHYPADDRSVIASPRVTLHRPAVLWQIDSSVGHLSQDPETFTLQGDVTILRTSQNSEPLQIHTSTLSIFTSGNEVRTDQPIEIIANTWQLRSVGLQSAIDAGKLKLLSNVTGHYEVVKPSTQD